MNIAYIAAGAGGMYCGSCLHDNTLAAAMSRQGDRVTLVPTYTPLRTDETDVSEPRVFFGGINVFLQEKVPLFRHTPWWFDRLWDMPWLLRLATKNAGATDPAKLGELTISMIQGEDGHQKKELDKLVAWLAAEVRPDVVHLSNAMLLGMARQIRDELGVPVVCTLSGEDIFLNRLKPPHAAHARDLLAERARDAAALVALNRYYAGAMAEYLRVDSDGVHVIPHGLWLDGHGERRPRSVGDPCTIGFLARICHDKGFHLLTEAFVRLCRHKDIPPLYLRAAGYLAPTDRRYLEKARQTLVRAGLADRFDYLGEPDRAGKIAFLQSLDVMALPTVYRESKGISVLEAWANGVPVVVPRHGAFPELIADTDGGLLCDPEDPDSLADHIADLIRDPDRAILLGRQGQAAVRDRYHADAMARRTRELYEELMK